MRHRQRSAGPPDGLIGFVSEGVGLVYAAAVNVVLKANLYNAGNAVRRPEFMLADDLLKVEGEGEERLFAQVLGSLADLIFVQRNTHDPRLSILAQAALSFVDVHHFYVDTEMLPPTDPDCTHRLCMTLRPLQASRLEAAIEEFYDLPAVRRVETRYNVVQVRHGRPLREGPTEPSAAVLWSPPARARRG